MNRLRRPDIVIPLTYREGNRVNRGCLMTAISIVTGTPEYGDHPRFVADDLRQIGVWANDVLPANLRARILSPLIWELPEQRPLVNENREQFIQAEMHKLLRYAPYTYRDTREAFSTWADQLPSRWWHMQRILRAARRIDPQPKPRFVMSPDQLRLRLSTDLFVEAETCG